MTIETAELLKLASLAKLKLSSEEQAACEMDLNEIMAMITDMQSVDTTGIDAMANPLDAIQVLRNDEVTESVEREIFQSLSDHTEQGLYTVPKVLE